MQIIIPMAGSGARFVRAGHRTIKPLIEADGLPIVEHVVRMFPGEQDFLFIAARPHLEETPLRSVLQRLAPGATIVAIEPHKLGPVNSALQAAEHIRDDVPVVLNYCDFSVYWDYAHFRRRLAELDPAGCITAYRGFHPHSLGPNLYAYMRERDNYMLEIREKGCFTGQRMSEYASAGTYYFRSGKLLKRYFRRAVDRGLQTNGEYYASTPFNLLVEDGLDVYIYELEHFLQWGTPEDLAEYQKWSDYFARFAGWRPSLPPMPGAVLIPMAGAGARFSREGYAQPKPLVPVNGAPMVRRALDTLPAAQANIAVCRAEHLAGPALAAHLTANNRPMHILPLDYQTEGQACTCLAAREHLDPEAPLLIAPCDTAMVYDQERYAALTAGASGVDCLAWTFRDHPHANRNPRHYGWVRATGEGRILGISCKIPLHDDVHRDPGIVGAFWFRKARYFLEAADALVAQNWRINGEFYVDSAIEVLVEQGRSAQVFDVDHYICFGTPDDVHTYEYWADYFRKAAHHPFGKGERTRITQIDTDYTERMNNHP
jgi:NDP-sugar pyrophosphorylase family protein